MSDYDEEEQSEAVQEVYFSSYALQIQDIIGIGLTVAAGCLQQIALGTQQLASDVFASGNLRRKRGQEVQARAEAAAAMGLLGTEEPRDG